MSINTWKSWWRTFAWPWFGFSDLSNAALEWQAGSLGCRSKEILGACPLEGLVRRLMYLFKYPIHEIQYYIFVVVVNLHLLCICISGQRTHWWAIGRSGIFKDTLIWHIERWPQNIFLIYHPAQKYELGLENSKHCGSIFKAAHSDQNILWSLFKTEHMQQINSARSQSKSLRWTKAWHLWTLPSQYFIFQEFGSYHHWQITLSRSP